MIEKNVGVQQIVGHPHCKYILINLVEQNNIGRCALRLEREG